MRKNAFQAFFPRCEAAKYAAQELLRATPFLMLRCEAAKYVAQELLRATPFLMLWCEAGKYAV